MAFKAKLPLLLFFFGSFLLCFTSSLAYEKDLEQQLQECTGFCEKQEKFRDYCKLKCGEEYVKQKEEQKRRGEGGSTSRDVFNTDPQKESEECQHRCELLRLPHQKIQQCKERCEEKRREQERQEQRGGGGSDFYNVDPQREYQQCQSRCQQQERGSQQQQCQQRCEEKLKEQEREGRRGGDNRVDPQREYQQCQSRCQEQERGSQQQQQCQQRCEEKLREQERGEGRRGGDNRVDPQREYQQCQSRCQQQERGSQQQQCQQRCEEKLKEQEREGRRDGDNRVDPQREYQQCQSRCQEQERGSQQQQQCQQRCEEKLREQERGEGRRGGDNRADPQREYQQCQSRCQQQERGSQQQQCQQRCEEKLKEQEREGRRDGDNRVDPQREYQQCQSRCQEQERGSQQQQQQQCQQRCEEKLREQERGEGRRGGDNRADPQREYQQCQSRCQQQERGSQQQQCQQRCEEKLREQEREGRRGGDDNADPQREYQQCQSRCQEQERGQQQQCQERCEEKHRQPEREEGQQQQQGRNNPYFFDEQSFIEKYRTEEGRIRVLPKFTQRSNLHRGIENYRLAIFEANPNTFVIPNHWDADAVIYVVKGRGTISMIRKQKRDSFNLERGDVIRVPSGSVVYMVNRDNNEQLQIAKLSQPISKTGHVHEFFGVGAEEPESFYRTFTNDVLEAAFNTPIDKLEKMFGQQKKGVIIRASKEQVQALSKQASSSSKGSSLWPRGGGTESRGPYNILNEKPKYSNNRGELYEVKPNDYKQLQDLDIAVSFVNLTKGAMMAPYYNTRATKLILVVEGRGRFEMACPHLARHSEQQSPRREWEQEQQEKEQGGAHYQRVSAHLSPKTMFIVPTGHPVAIIASDNENLQLVAFTINAQDSKRNFLAGKENVVNQMEKEAIELGFNMPSKEVQEIYNRQKESVFVPGPNQRQQQRERGSHGLSILDF